MSGTRSPLAAVDRVGDAARAVLAHHAKTFQWASWFLHRTMRRDAAIVYAFCRLVDDAVDDAASTASAYHRIAEIKGMLAGNLRPSDLVQAYREAAERLGFGLDPARALLAGVESDLGRVRFVDDAELLTYCYRVAGTVGLMMCGVLGVTSRTARVHAVQLGIAMQLSNICRDVREDAYLGRVYLPRTRLLASGLSETEFEPSALCSANTAVRRSVSHAVLGLIEDSERVYSLAARGFQYLPARPRLAILVAANLYRAIGSRLRAHAGDALAGRTVVPSWRKAGLACMSVGTWLVQLLLPRHPAHLLEAPFDFRSKRLVGPHSPGSHLRPHQP